MPYLNDHLPCLNAWLNTLYRTLRLYLANRSHKALHQLFYHLFLKARGFPTPVFIQIGTTYQCQCHCVHCYADAPKHDGKEMTLREIKSVIDQAKELGVLQVIFTGGEPLLRHDIAQMVRYAHDAGLITRINSNGVLLDLKNVINLKKSGLTQCHVSIDDTDPDMHDQLRGLTGSYEKAVQGIRNLRKAGILCQILSFASKRNVTSGLERIISLGKNLGVMCTYIVFPVASGRYDQDRSQLLTEKEKKQVRKLQNVFRVHLELPTQSTQCSVTAKSAFFVSPCGDFTPCPPIPYVIGNIREQSLKDMWLRLCNELKLECRGYCPMNKVQARETIKKNVQAIAAERKVSATY